MVRKREGQFDLESVREELNRRIGTIFAKQRLEPVLFPSSPADIPDDTDGPYLAVIHWEGHTVEQANIHLPELVVRLFKEKGDNANVRLNRNNLVFVCADALQVDDMLRKARTYVALQQMQQGDLFASLQSHQQDQVKERYGQAQQGFALAVQQCYRHVFYPERGQWPKVPLTHAAITVTSASSEPGVGQKQVERVLREARELVLAEDAPPAPNYMADKTPLKRVGVMSTRDLRNEYYRDPALPPGTLSISEDAKIFTMDKALELSVWPPKTSDPDAETGVDQPTVFGGDAGTTPVDKGGETGTAVQVGLGSTSTGSGGAGVAQPAGPGVIERTDNVKTALTQLAQQVSSSGKAIKSLTWRMNSGDGFLPMALLKAEPGATVRVEMMEGGWSSGDGSAEWSFTFNGTPEEATHLRGFIEGQGRRGGEKDLDIKYQLEYDPPLRWDDGGEAWIGRLTRAGLGTQTATIHLELSTATEGQP